MKKQALSPDMGEKKETRKKTVWVDIDGTLAKYSGWHGIDKIGDPFPGAAEFMRNLQEFARVGIYTTRTNNKINKEPLDELVAHVEKWLYDNDIPYDEVYADEGKPIGSAFIDDRAISCRPEEDDLLINYSEVLEQAQKLVDEDTDNVTTEADE